MTSYRFCRTDDKSVLCDAYNRCWLPHFPKDPPFDVAMFKGRIRQMDLWCSSSMVAFAGAEPVAFLWGCKRPTETLVDKIATHPDHLRQGHARHLLTSLSSKLAILGPPRLVAEVPEEQTATRALFEACGYVEEVTLVDYALDPSRLPARPERAAAVGAVEIPVTLDDLTANGFLSEGPRQRCWSRDIASIRRHGDPIEGIAVATDDGIEAFVLHRSSRAGGREIVALHAADEVKGEPYLAALLSRCFGRGDGGPVRFQKLHPEEAARAWLHSLGFEAGGRYLRYSAVASAS